MARLSRSDRRDSDRCRGPRGGPPEGTGRHDRPGCRRRDGHIERPRPPLLREHGRGPRGRLRPGRRGRSRPVRRGDGGGRQPDHGARRVLPDLCPGRRRLGVSALARRVGGGRPAAGHPGHLAPPQSRLAGAPRADDRGGRGCRHVRHGGPGAAAWRILSLVDGLALQVVAHGTTIGRDDVERWAASAAELELGLEPGTLGGAAG